MSLSRLWQRQAGPATASFAVSRYERLRGHLPVTSKNLAILRSFTVEPVIPLLRAGAFVGNLDLNVRLGDFNAYTQEILDPTSQLYTNSPDIVVLAIQTRDIAPKLWEEYSDLSGAQISAAMDQVIGTFHDLIRAFRANSSAYLIVHNLEVPRYVSRGILDNQTEMSQVEAIQEINRNLRRIAKEHVGVYVLDYDGLVAHHGRSRWFDENKWLTMRMPLSADSLLQLANEWLRYVHPLTGKICKVLVTDLDNTLWRGVIGEHGMDGIEIGSDYPGVAHQTLQRAMLDLYKRGILLAICSKNNRSDAMEVLEKHPGMLLRPNHFAAFRINWNDKAQNLREIAAELNIGTEALAFVDDNPIERKHVRMILPEVTIIDLPDDPMMYSESIRENPVFERLTLSEEDRERGRYYAMQRQRVELKTRHTLVDDFYRSLQQEAEVALLTSATAKRIAQLTQKTNQFNLTTHRYSEQDLTELAETSDWDVYSLNVRDVFGNNGLIGVAILRYTERTCEIDTFLLSCRVIGRTIETAFLSYLIQEARTAKVRQLYGWYYPTKKNQPARNFYKDHGFELIDKQKGGTFWSLELGRSAVQCPEWITLKNVLKG